MIPPPRYSLAHLDTVLDKIYSFIEIYPKGKGVFNVFDKNTYSQNILATWFKGFSIPLPIFLVFPIYLFFNLIPGKKGYTLRCLYWKIFQSNIYTTEQL